MPWITPKSSRLFYIAILILTSILVYSPCLRADFLNWDDDRLVTDNHLVQNLSLKNIPYFFQTTVNKTYTPLTSLCFSVEYAFWGKNPFPYHLMNILLHAIVSGLVFFLILRLGLSQRIAFFSAVLFSIHPLHVESVAWITARKDMLYAFFYLLALFFYWDYLKTHSGKKYILAFVAGILSMLAKPMAISLPLILFLFDGLAGRKWSKTILVDKIPFFLTLVPLAGITVLLNSRPLSFSWPDSVLIWLWCFAFYIKNFFLPIGLSPVYLLPKPITLAHPDFWSSLVIFIIFVAGLFYGRRNRWIVWAGLYYILSMFFLWRYDAVDPSLVVDRYMYLACLGFCVVSAIGFNQLQDKLSTQKLFSRVVSIGGILVALALAQTSYRQCAVWKNSNALWDFVLTRTAGTSSAYNNQGEIYSRQGNHVQAMANFKKAIALDPKNVEAYYNIGVTLTLEQRFDEALTYYNQAIRVNSTHAKAFNNRGFIYARIQGEADMALADLNKALSLDPNLAEAYNNRGFVYDRMKNKPEIALADYNRAIDLKPDLVEAHFFRGVIWGEIKGNQELAIKDFDEAIRLDPTYEEAYSSRGVAKMMLNRRDEALADFNQTIILNPNSFPGHINRGGFFLQTGDYRRAIENYNQALILQPDNVQALRLRAEAFAAMDDLPSAMNDLNHAILVAPEDTSLQQQREQLQEKTNGRASALSDKKKQKPLKTTNE